MTTFNGTDLRVFMDTKLIAGEGECSISFSHDPRDANTKDSGRWEASAEGALSAEISASGLVIRPGEAGTKKTFADLFAAFKSATSVTLVFALASGENVDTAFDQYTGEFRITGIEKTGAHRGTIEFSASFSSTGEVEEIAGLGS